MSGRGQVGALFSLRWRMVRSRKVRIGLLVLAAVTLGILVMAIASSATVPLGRPSSGTLSATDLMTRSDPSTARVRSPRSCRR